MKLSRKRSLCKNSRSRNRRNKTRSRKIRKQYGGNLNSQQRDTIIRIMRSLKFRKNDISKYIRDFNSVSTLLDPEFDDYIKGFKELLEEAERGGALDDYRTLLQRSTKDGKRLDLELIENEIMLEKQETFRSFFDGVISELKEQIDSRGVSTDSETD